MASTSTMTAVVAGSCLIGAQAFAPLAVPQVSTQASTQVGLQHGLAQGFSSPAPAAPATSNLGMATLAASSVIACSLMTSKRSRHQGSRKVIACNALNYANLVMDITRLVKEKNCGPILIRLSWHDAGVYSNGTLKGGCPNAAMRFTDGGEGTFGANAGLPDVAVGLLAPIAEKYVPNLISHADLWTLAANLSIKIMGGPEIPTRFGRVDAKSSKESVESQAGRLPDGDKRIPHLREIFHPKGFDDKDIVALSGAHTVGKCHLGRSGFDGPWTERPLKFDNTYFSDLLKKTYAPETTAKGCPQHRNPNSGTIMLESDLALLDDPAFKSHVETYAADQKAYFADFTKAWVKLQENGVTSLRDTL